MDEQKTGKRNAIILICIILFSALAIFIAGDVNTLIYTPQAKKEISSLCFDFGMYETDVIFNVMTDENDRLYFGVSVFADGEFEDDDPRIFKLIDDIDNIEKNYGKKAKDPHIMPKYMSVELIFNGSEYREWLGIIYKDDKPVQYESLDLKFSKEYENEIPHVGMPAGACGHTSYGSYKYYNFTGTPSGYYWNQGGYKIIALISEEKKEFDGFSDYYVTEIKKEIHEVPYTGMKEEYIGRTALGTPSGPMKPHYENRNGSYMTVNEYEFYRGGKVIFKVECVKDGCVISVEDYRKNPYKPFTLSESSSSGKKDDPYDAKNYADAEGFYYDHYDNFWDYEEAEEYFNEHSN